MIPKQKATWGTMPDLIFDESKNNININCICTCHVDGFKFAKAAQINLCSEVITVPCCDCKDSDIDLFRRIDNLENDLKEANRRLEVHSKILRQTRLAPFKCPVCNGIGKGNKYTSNECDRVIFWVCEPCDGKGIVWG